MGKIISFEKHQDRNKKICMFAQTAETYNDSKTLNTLLCYISSETSKILSRTGIENLIKIGRNNRKNLKRSIRIYYCQHPHPMQTSFNTSQVSC